MSTQLANEKYVSIAKNSTLIGVRKIAINRGLFVIVDDADYEWLADFRWTALFHTSAFVCKAYAVTTAPGNRTALRGHRRTALMHRMITGAPDGLEVDHINGEGLDNRRVNLRICTRAQNAACGSQRANARHYRGVRKAGKKWAVSIVVDGRLQYFGRFSDPITAAQVADEIHRAQWGEFTRPNFPDELAPILTT